MRLLVVLTRSLPSLFAVAAILMLTAGPAAADSALISSQPADDATVDRPPVRVVLTFHDPDLAVGTSVVVTDAAGREVQSDTPQLAGTTLTQPLQPEVPAGPYVVTWRVTSTDGHLVTGTFTFTARQAAAGPPPTSTASPSTAPTSDSSGRLPAGLKLVIGLAAIVFGVTVARRSGRRADTNGPRGYGR